MSHNVRLANVKFTSLDILRAAVAELKAEGGKFELVEGPGLTYRSVGVHPCDVLLKSQNGPWDVGFVREEIDGVACYVPRIESDLREPFLSSGSGKPLAGCRVDYGALAIGRLVQRYAVLTAEINAAQQGAPTTRHRDPTTDRISLTVG